MRKRNVLVVLDQIFDSAGAVLGLLIDEERAQEARIVMFDCPRPGRACKLKQ